MFLESYHKEPCCGVVLYYFCAPIDEQRQDMWNHRKEFSIHMPLCGLSLCPSAVQSVWSHSPVSPPLVSLVSAGALLWCFVVPDFQFLIHVCFAVVSCAMFRAVQRLSSATCGSRLHQYVTAASVGTSYRAGTLIRDQSHNHLHACHVSNRWSTRCQTLWCNELQKKKWFCCRSWSRLSYH